MGYLHTTEGAIRKIGQKISEAREKHEQQPKEDQNPGIIKFEVS
jgi:hypothetical protein